MGIRSAIVLLLFSASAFAQEHKFIFIYGLNEIFPNTEVTVRLNDSKSNNSTLADVQIGSSLRKSTFLLTSGKCIQIDGATASDSMTLICESQFCPSDASGSPQDYKVCGVRERRFQINIDPDFKCGSLLFENKKDETSVWVNPPARLISVPTADDNGGIKAMATCGLISR